MLHIVVCVLLCGHTWQTGQGGLGERVLLHLLQVLATLTVATGIVGLLIVGTGGPRGGVRIGEGWEE